MKHIQIIYIYFKPHISPIVFINDTFSVRVYKRVREFVYCVCYRKSELSVCSYF